MYPDRKRRFARMSGLSHPRTKVCRSHFVQGRRYGSRGSRSGFTLVEMLIVMAILSIVALTAIPMMSSAASIQIRSAANMVAADIEYARSMAISRGQNYSVEFDKDTDRYCIKDQAGSVIPHPVKKGFLYAVDFRTDSRLKRVDITNATFGAVPRVEFDCLGSPKDGGVINLQAGAVTATIAVEPVTGFISIQ